MKNMHDNQIFKFSGFIIVMFLCTTFIDCSKLPITISKVDDFPHHIDKDFIIVVHHPDFKEHHLYAVIVLEVKNNVSKQYQTISLYPGFMSELERKLKGELFHIKHYEVIDFQTKVIVRFLRSSNGGEFSISYSLKGGETYNHVPKDLMLIYNNTINLFRPPHLNLIIKTPDNHMWGLTINKPGLITCSASDGFPVHNINVKLPELNFMKSTYSNYDMVAFEFIAQLSDHLKKVTCQSGGNTTTKQINVFHHASSVEIFPDNMSYMKQSNTLECRSLGGGFPTPQVNWTVSNYKNTNGYFTIRSSGSISYLTINPITPNKTQWVFKCSSFNTIPYLGSGGPYKTVDVTIGENPKAAKLASARVWTISMAIVVFVIVLLIAILCVGSRIRCTSRGILTKNQKPLENADATMKFDYSNIKEDDYEDNQSNSREEYIV